MVSEVTIDAAGRLTLPEALRRQFRLEPGDTLRVEDRNGEITLLPVRNSPHMIKEDGIWIYRSGQPAEYSLQAIIDAGREDRDIHVLGLDK
jgi:AbrB family looped-hinge helix DNA binding protein